ncbi:hypothetical protein IAR55_002323 [Kwoniella newhampshirensis]|uniref:Protein kinase domain-containing protein n=1 Tax=Kwoniella newhampshirensis TaxID=1651941 RepID=A0AAW0YR96_9TREE
MPADPTPRSTLTRVGGWKLGQTLGRGAYAHVRLATHPNGHKAACKILPALHREPGRVSWDHTVDAIEAHKEVVLLKALTGAGLGGIVGLEGVMEEGGWTYVFLTLYPYSASSSHVVWTRERLVTFFRRLLLTIHALHELGVSHEDIKRSNILMDKDGMPILVDFGFSHFRPHGGSVKSAGGTLDYSSPEKTADIPYDAKANDVWSLGILLIKLLDMDHPFVSPFQEDTSTTIKRRIICDDPLFAWAQEDLAPGGLASLIYGMLQKNPKVRWTILQILNHPWLQPFYREPPVFQGSTHAPKSSGQITEEVFQDLCFLSFIAGEFSLCQTPKSVLYRLQYDKRCWERRWAGMLAAWSKREEMDWEDIPSTIPPLKARSEPSRNAKALQLKHGRVLREIHLSPNTPASSMRPKFVEHKKQKENVPPNMPRKSRLYGMKTKEDSTRKTDHTLVNSLKAKENAVVVDRDKQTAVISSPEKGRLGVAKTKKTKSDVETLRQYGESSTRVTTRLPLAPRRTTRANISNPTEIAVAMNGSASTAVTGKMTIDRIAKRGESTTKVERVQTKVGSSSVPDKKLKGLLLDLPEVPEPRRRSPRLHGKPPLPAI